jgi:ferric-dicitrate binding protein FerR (iron transport regulator)
VTDAHRPAAPDPTDADGIGPLVRLAGRRPLPDHAPMLRARAAAHAEWARVVRWRAWRMSLSIGTIAALAIAGLGALTWIGMRPAPAPAPGLEIATLQTLTGALFVTSVDVGRRVVADTGAPLRAGDRIDTSEGSRAALSLHSGISIRFDSATSAVLDSAGRLTLDRGAVYVDANHVSQDSGLAVHTAFGNVHHVGTQFEVRLHDGRLRVSVREGVVAVERGDRRWTSRAGERLLLDADTLIERQPIATSGADWRWVNELAQPFRLEGATVRRFLDWASRELGVRWEYEDTATQRRVDQVVLHGSVEGLTPEEALAAVLPTCGLSFSLQAERMVVAAAR